MPWLTKALCTAGNSRDTGLGDKEGGAAPAEQMWGPASAWEAVGAMWQPECRLEGCLSA